MSMPPQDGARPQPYVGTCEAMPPGCTAETRVVCEEVCTPCHRTGLGHGSHVNQHENTARIGGSDVASGSSMNIRAPAAGSVGFGGGSTQDRYTLACEQAHPHHNTTVLGHGFCVNTCTQYCHMMESLDKDHLWTHALTPLRVTGPGWCVNTDSYATIVS